MTDLISDPRSNTGYAIPKSLISVSPLFPMSGDFWSTVVHNILEWVAQVITVPPKVMVTWCRQWEHMSRQADAMLQAFCKPPGGPLHCQHGQVSRVCARGETLPCSYCTLNTFPFFFFFLFVVTIAEKWACISGENPVWSGLLRRLEDKILSWILLLTYSSSYWGQGTLVITDISVPGNPEQVTGVI